MLRSFQIVRHVGRQRQLVKGLRGQTARSLTSSCVRNHVLRRIPITQGTHSFTCKISVARHAYSTGNFPPFYQVPLPALSPTMEKGSLVRWIKEEGEQLSEGDLLAEIETDKATMGFETPEEGYLAKILAPAGTRDVPVGQLLCVIVENEADIAAFKDFKASDVEGSSTPSAAADAAADAAAAAGPRAAAFDPPSNYPDHIIVNLPALSPTMEHGSIKSWSVEVGAEVAEGDLLAEIETDKATVGMESSEDGIVAKIIVAAGTRDIPLGTQLCVLVQRKDDIAAFADYAPAAAAAAPAPAVPAASAPPPPAPAPPAPARGGTLGEAAGLPAAPAPAAAAAAASRPAGGVAATPYAKKLAAEKGIDLALVRGTGPAGEVKGTDVENFVPSAAAPAAAAPAASAPAAATRAAPAPAPTVPGAAYTDIPLGNIRQVIAKRLLESKTTIPHYYLTVECEMDNITKLRQDLNKMLEKEKVKLSVNDFIIKAASLACKKVPEANSSWQDSFIRQYNTVDMCVAVATENGLITPIVTGADKKGLASISQDVQALAALAREGKLQPHQYQGGTFTISNLGMFGIKAFSAIINPPQACILAVGGSEQRLVADTDSAKGYRASSVMSVTLSCDHRVVDGAVGAQWLKHFKGYLEKPHTMLL